MFHQVGTTVDVCTYEDIHVIHVYMLMACSGRLDFQVFRLQPDTWLLTRCCLNTQPPTQAMQMRGRTGPLSPEPPQQPERSKRGQMQNKDQGGRSEGLKILLTGCQHPDHHHRYSSQCSVKIETKIMKH